MGPMLRMILLTILFNFTFMIWTCAQRVSFFGFWQFRRNHVLGSLYCIGRGRCSGGSTFGHARERQTGCIEFESCRAICSEDYWRLKKGSREHQERSLIRGERQDS